MPKHFADGHADYVVNLTPPRSSFRDQRSRRLRSGVSQSKAIAQDFVDHKTQGDLQQFVKDSTDDSNASVPEIQ